MSETSAQAFADLKAQNTSMIEAITNVKNIMDTVGGDVATLLQKVSEGTVSVSDIQAELTRVKSATDQAGAILAEGQAIDKSVNPGGSSNFGEVPAGPQS